MHLLPASDTKDGGKLILASHAQEGGILTNLRQTGSTKATTYASVLDLDLPDITTTDLRDDLRGGRLFHDSAIQLSTTLDAYPRSYNAVADWTELGSQRDVAIYVGIMSTDNTDSNPNFDPSNPFPDITAGGDGGIQPRGVGYSISLKRLHYKNPDFLESQSSISDPATSNEVKETFRDEWNREYATTDDRNIFLSTVLYLPRKSSTDILLMAGTTRGYGPAFATDEPTMGDLDGFITKINPNTGDLITGTPKDSIRIESDPGKDETLLGICASPTSENVDHVYAVGSTRYLMTETLPEQTRPVQGQAWHAYILKLSVDDMSVIWVRQIGSTVVDDKQTDVIGLGCAVTNDEKDVYLTGTVKNGGVIPEEDEADPNVNHGGDDVFLASFDAGNGAFYFVRQFGTDGQDAPVRGDGSLVVDEDGNVMVLGNSNGGIARSSKDDENSEMDYFVVWAERYTGFIKELAENNRNKRNPIVPPPPGDISNEKTIPQPTTIFPSGNGGGGNNDAGDANGGDKGDDISVFGKSVMILLWIGATFCLGGVGFRILHSRNAGIAREISEHHVRKHLDRLSDDINIDTRKSATGGIHGMYVEPDDTYASSLQSKDLVGGEELTLSTTPTFGHDERSVGAHSAPPMFVDEKNPLFMSSSSRSGRPMATRGGQKDDPIVRDSLFMDDIEPMNDPREMMMDDNDDDAMNNALIPTTAASANHAYHNSGMNEDDDEDEGLMMMNENEKWGAGYDGLNESWEERNNYPSSSSSSPVPNNIPPKSSFRMPGRGRDSYTNDDDDDDDSHEGIV